MAQKSVHQIFAEMAAKSREQRQKSFRRRYIGWIVATACAYGALVGAVGVAVHLSVQKHYEVDAPGAYILLLVIAAACLTCSLCMCAARERLDRFEDS